MAKDKSTLKLIQTGDSIKQRYKKQAAEIPEDFIFEGLKIMKNNPDNRTDSFSGKLSLQLFPRFSQLKL